MISATGGMAKKDVPPGPLLVSLPLEGGGGGLVPVCHSSEVEG
jgi:hypothetical protein